MVVSNYAALIFLENVGSIFNYEVISGSSGECTTAIHRKCRFKRILSRMIRQWLGAVEFLDKHNYGCILLANKLAD